MKLSNRIEFIIEGSNEKDYGYLVVNDATLQVELDRIKIKTVSDLEMYKRKLIEKYKNHPIVSHA